MDPSSHNQLRPRHWRHQQQQQQHQQHRNNAPGAPPRHPRHVHPAPAQQNSRSLPLLRQDHHHHHHHHQQQQQQQQQHASSFSALNPLPLSTTLSDAFILPTGALLPSTASTPLLPRGPVSDDPAKDVSLRSALPGVGIPADDNDRGWSCTPCRQRRRRCDGARPFCGYCARTGLSLACTDVGFQARPADPDSKGDVATASAEWESKLATVDPSWHVTPDTLTEMLLKASLQENLFSPSYYPVVDNARPDVGAARLPPRQGADPNEVDALSEAYFRRRTGLIEVIHKQSFMRDRGTAPAFLQAAVCALGAADASLVTRTNSVAVYYYDFARSRALDACDSPSLENMQALLILADLSLHLGRFSVGRLLFSFANRMTQILELDTDPDDLPRSFSPVEKEARRRCWWMCFLLESYVSATSYRPPSPYKPTAVKPICLDEVWLSDDPSAVALIAPQPPDSPFDAYLKIHDIHLGVIRTCTKMNSAPLLLEADFQRLLECGDALGQFSMTIQPDISVEMDSISEWLTTGTTDDVTLPSLVRWRISIFCTYHACTVLLTNRHLLSLRPHSGAHLGDPSSEVDLPRLKLALDKGLDAAAAVAALVSRLNDLSIHCPTLAVVPLFIVAHFLVIADAAEGAPTLATLTPPLPPPLPPSSTRHRTHPRASASAAANPVRDNTRTRDPARTLLAPFVTHFMLGQKIRPSFCVGFRAFSGLCDLGWPGMPSPSSFPPSSSSSRVAAPAAAAAPQPSTSTTSMLASPLSPAASDVVVVGGDNDNDNDDGDGDGDGSRSLLDAAVASWLTAPEMTGRFVGVSAFAPLWRAVRGVGGGGGGGVEGVMQ